VSLEKAGWLATVIACLIAVVILLALAYYGYAATVGCVGVSAAINLR
jgi:ABC-type transporter Mla maintaining outer membrane lipid asymmetry permease subunit MlaE